MSLPEGLAILGVGLAAGTINTIVGSGSLITFPTLLAFGYPPVLANVSNNVGLVPGVLSGVVAYRRELQGQRTRLAKLGSAGACGGLLGAILLLALPHSVFRHVVPALILLACVLVALQPAITKALSNSRRHPHGGPFLLVGIFVTSIYGGYFGAAQSVIYISLLGIFLDDGLQRLNAAKNVISLLVNATSALVFIGLTHVAWSAAGLLAAGSICGGQIGAAVARRIAPQFLRAVIVGVGLVAAIVLLK